MLKSADYDALGRMKTIEVGETTGGATLVTNSYSYDTTNARLTRVQGVVPSSTPLDLSVSFDGLGRLSSQTGTLGAEAVSRSYTYDGLSRLKTAVGPWEKATGATDNITWTYSYDALGNLRGQASTRSPANLADVRTWSYGHATKPHFLTSFAQQNQPTETLSANLGGELSIVSQPSFPTKVLTWNAQGKLYRFKDSTYSYDVFDQATLVVTGPTGSTTSIVSVGEDFEYDIGALRANKFFSVEGVRIASLATSYTAPTAAIPPALRIVIRFAEPLAAPGAAALVALGLLGLASLTLRRRTPVWLAVPGVGVLSFALVALPYTAHAATLTSGPGAYGRHGEPILAYLVDHLGTIRGAVNQAGVVVETRDYAPFGESIAHTGSFSVEHRFTGQPQDDQAGGLYNCGARFYNAKWGRFISPDELVQGFDSQGLNAFSYVLNRPTSATDPTGQMIINGVSFGAWSTSTTGTYEVRGHQPHPGERHPNPSGRGAHALALYFSPPPAPPPKTPAPGRAPAQVSGSTGLDITPLAVGPAMSSLPVSPAIPSLPGVDIDLNIQKAQRHWLNVFWFRSMVRNKGPWDYKQFGSDYEAFGNFNYGATGRALGLPEWFLLREAGRVQQRAGTSRPEWGDPGSRFDPNGGTGSYGDDPVDQFWIHQGSRYAEEMMSR